MINTRRELFLAHITLFLALCCAIVAGVGLVHTFKRYPCPCTTMSHKYLKPLGVPRG